MRGSVVGYSTTEPHARCPAGARARRSLSGWPISCCRYSGECGKPGSCGGAQRRHRGQSSRRPAASWTSRPALVAPAGWGVVAEATQRLPGCTVCEWCSSVPPSNLWSPCRGWRSRRGRSGAGGWEAPPGAYHPERAHVKSRVAIMRGGYLLGLSTANRKAAGVSTGDEVRLTSSSTPSPRRGRARGFGPRARRRLHCPRRLRPPRRRPQAAAHSGDRER
jgi:hypothetical protein